MKIIVNIGTNYKGSLERAKKIVDATRYYANGYVIPRFGQKYANKKKQKHFDTINFTQDEFIDLVTHIGEGFEIILEPTNSKDVQSSKGIDGIKLLSEHFNHKPIIEATVAKDLPIYLDTSGLDEVNLSGFLSNFDGMDVTLLHGNARFSIPTEAEQINAIHIMDIIQLYVLSSLEQEDSQIPKVGYVARFPHRVLLPALTLYGIEYLEVFVDLTDKEGFEADASITPQELEELHKNIKFMKEAYRCSCFNRVEDLHYVSINKRDPNNDWLVTDG